jgi:hypothetical protein
MQYSFIHLAFCLMTGPKPLPKRALHILRSRAFSFRCEHPLLSWRSSSSFLRFLPRLTVTSIFHFIFHSITCCRRQFLRKMWPIQLSFRLFISCRTFLCSLTLSNIKQHTKFFYLPVSLRKVAIVFVPHEVGSDPQGHEMLRTNTIIDILSLCSVAAIKNFRFLSSEW